MEGLTAHRGADSLSGQGLVGTNFVSRSQGYSAVLVRIRIMSDPGRDWGVGAVVVGVMYWNELG